MKKFSFVFAVLAMFSLSFANCTKTSEGPGQPGVAAPDEAVGEWQYGSASMTEIWDNATDTFLGNAFELSIRFIFKKDGTYEEYFVAGSTTLGTCRTNVFNIETGTVTFDAAGNTFTTHAKKVKNKFYNCGKVSSSEKTSDLKSNTYNWRRTTASSGTPVLEIKPVESQNYSVFYKK
jgi:predicted small secreted protein